MIDFSSTDFVEACKNEIKTKGYCYLIERLSRRGGQVIEYLLEKEEEIQLLPKRKQSIWTILVSKESPFLEDIYIKEAGSIELTVPLLSIEGRKVNAEWAYKAHEKVKALVYTDGQIIFGAY
jgi:hypothetical protein